MTPDCFIALKKNYKKTNKSAAVRPDALLGSSKRLKEASTWSPDSNKMVKSHFRFVGGCDHHAALNFFINHT